MSSLAVYANVEDRYDDLVKRHTSLVQRIAYHLLMRLPPVVQSEDLIQAGMVGLLEAARRFDPTQGASFATFAEQRIRGAMLDEIRKGDWAPRSVHRRAREVTAAIQAVEADKGAQARDQEVAEYLGVSLTEYHQILIDLRGQKLLSIDDLSLDGNLANEHLPSIEIDSINSVQHEHVLRQLTGAVERLPEREQLVLALYYDEGLNLKEIGAVLEVSESRVSQLHGQALARLRARVEF